MEINRSDDGDQKKNSGKRKGADDEWGGVLEGQKKQNSMKSSYPTPKMPERFKNYIWLSGFSGPVLVMQRILDKSLFDEQQRFLLVPSEGVNQGTILTDEQKQVLDQNPNKYMLATLIGPSLYYGSIPIKKWDNFHYALNIGIKELEQHLQMRFGTLFQLWSLNKKGSELGFALFEVDKTKFQEMKKAREIPEEIKNRITGFGGSELVFLIKKKLLLSDVNRTITNSYRFSIPLDKLENQFLSDEEMDFLKVYDEGYHAVLIGPSIGNKGVKEFNIKLRKMISYIFEGEGWMRFVRKYGLKVGKKVRVWSFRWPSAKTKSRLGTGILEIGFAIAVVDEDEEEKRK